MHIQWYPGHMTKTKRMMQAHIALVDIVIELLDARVPYSSRNPDIDKLAAGKYRIIVLNKADLARPVVTNQWEAYFQKQGLSVIVMNSLESKAVSRLVEAARGLMQEKIERQQKRGRVNVPIRAMIAGIPNVGKSTFINQLAGRASAATGDRPGITRGKQWIKIKKDFDLLDTPGVLWPKFDDEAVGVKLAVTGAVADDILDAPTLCEALISLLMEWEPEALPRRYNIKNKLNKTPREWLEMIGAARGFIIKGGVVDITRTAHIVLDEFRGGKLGRISLERPPEKQVVV